jgi:hypothetical protein
VATYRVAFDGKWQETFDHQEQALEWAREVGDAGRIVHVAQRRLGGMKLIAVFPESRAEEARELWRTRGDGYLGVGGAIPPIA